MRLEWHPAVLADDLPDIYAFIARDNTSAAGRVLDAIEQTFDQLGQQAESGIQYRSGNPKLADIRMLPVRDFENYLIFYRIEGDVVRILYVLHGAQHLRSFFRRKPRE